MTPLRRRLKAAKRFSVYLLARSLTSLIRLLPTSWAIALGAGVGRVAGALAGPLRRRATRQLVERLQVDEPQARQLAAGVFGQLGRVGAEIVLLPRLRSKIEAYVELPEPDRARLREAMGGGRGAIVVTGHLGNWELLAQRLVADGHEAVTLARRSPNPYLGAWLVERRRAGGLGTLNRGGSDTIRGMLRALRRGALVGVLIDQDTRVDSVHVPFFGALAATPRAAASLALRRDIPVLAVFIRRRPSGHVLEVQRVEHPEPGDPEARIVALTADLTRRIEAAIRASPDEWVWFHERWKTPA